MPKYEKGHSSNEISELFSQCELLSIYVLGDYHCRPVDWILCCEAKFKIGQMYPMAYFRCGKQLHIFERYLSCGVLVSCSSLLIRTVKIRWTLESNFLHFNFHESLHGIQRSDAGVDFHESWNGDVIHFDADLRYTTAGLRETNQSYSNSRSQTRHHVQVLVIDTSGYKIKCLEIFLKTQD